MLRVNLWVRCQKSILPKKSNYDLAKENCGNSEGNKTKKKQKKTNKPKVLWNIKIELVLNESVGVWIKYNLFLLILP